MKIETFFEELTQTENLDPDVGLDNAKWQVEGWHHEAISKELMKRGWRRIRPRFGNRKARNLDFFAKGGVRVYVGEYEFIGRFTDIEFIRDKK